MRKQVFSTSTDASECIGQSISLVRKVGWNKENVEYAIMKSTQTAWQQWHHVDYLVLYQIWVALESGFQPNVTKHTIFIIK